MFIKTESCINKANYLDKYQFERIGYFCVDSDSKNDSIVMNMSVSLKEDKRKNSIN